MKKVLFPLLAVCIGCEKPITSTNVQGSGSSAVAPSMKEMELDEFLHGILAKHIRIPIKIAVPSEYQYFKFPKAPLSSYWMTQAGAESAIRTDDLPIQSGWIYGELSMGVSFNQTSRKFLGIESSSELTRNGFKVLEMSSTAANGVPIAFIELVHEASKKPIYMMYVATLFEDNVVCISYRPPKNNKAIGDAVWSSLKGCITRQANQSLYSDAAARGSAGELGR